MARPAGPPGSRLRAAIALSRERTRLAWLGGDLGDCAARARGAEAPAGATMLVVFLHRPVLAYIADADARDRFVYAVQALGAT